MTGDVADRTAAAAAAVGVSSGLAAIGGLFDEVGVEILDTERRFLCSENQS